MENLISTNRGSVVTDVLEHITGGGQVLHYDILLYKRIDYRKILQNVIMQDLTVCRVGCMTCWLKSDRGNLAVHPRSLREMLGVTRHIKFPDKGSMSESSKPAGCSESEPVCSLVT